MTAKGGQSWLNALSNERLRDFVGAASATQLRPKTEGVG